MKKNTAEAARWFQKLAQQDAPEAQYELGDCYYFGWGVEEDKPKACLLYTSRCV